MASEDITPEVVADESVAEIVSFPIAPFEKTATRVCIVGFADGHRADAPFTEPDMEFWGINRLHTVLPEARWTRWFEVHNLAKFYGEDDEHKTFLKECGIPVYVRPQDVRVAAEWGITTAVPYPRADAEAQFESYFTNSISYLIAMAIMLGFEEIHMYGVDMAQDNILHSEYGHQRPSCEYFIGVAQGHGIKVVLPPGSDLLKSAHWYGLDDDGFSQKLQARFTEVAKKKEQIRAEMNEYAGRAQFLQARISELDGAMQEITYQVRNLHPPAVG